MPPRRFLVPGRAWSATWRSAISDRISLVAAGCAFYAMLALIPSLTLTISVYGLWFDRASVEPQLALLHRVLPEDGARIISAHIRDLVSAPPAQLGLGAAISAAVAFWSASAGIRALLAALSLAHGRREERGVLAFYATALLLTLGVILAAAVALGVSVALPRWLGLDGVWAGLCAMAALYLAALIVVAMLYRFGPSRPPAGWRLFSPGAVLATTLWALASAAFSVYVARVGGYDALHGTLGTAIALLTWLYLGGYVILLGAELDAATARAKAPPMAEGPRDDAARPSGSQHPEHEEHEDDGNRNPHEPEQKGTHAPILS
jgi:membrane protein